MMEDYEGAQEIERAWREGLTPDPLLTVSEWSDRHRMLSSKASAEPGRWRTSRTPYLKAIMDCLSPTSPVERVVFMKAAQLGATEMGNNWIGYVIHHAPGPMMSYVGNVPELKVSLSVETLEHQESSSGQRLTDLQLIKTKKGEFSCTLEELIAVNLGLALYGTTVEQTSGTVTGETLPNPVSVGSLYLLAHQNVSALEISDASASPQTLAAEQYRLNAKYGSLEILDKTTGGPFVEPFSVDYAYGAAQTTALFTQPLPERWVRFEGLNTADSNREVVIDLYRVAINPAKELSLITDELLKFELSGQVLADTLKPANGELGQFGRIVLL